MTVATPDEGGQKTYVLDTNVLLYDPNALFVFHEHDVVIPIVVIEEIDRFKKDVNETGRNARQVSRLLDELRSKGSLGEGVVLDGGGQLRVDFADNVADEPISWGRRTTTTGSCRPCGVFIASSTGACRSSPATPTCA